MIKIKEVVFNIKYIVAVYKLSKWSQDILYFSISYNNTSTDMQFRYKDYNVTDANKEHFQNLIEKEKERLDNYLLDNSSTDNKVFFDIKPYAS